MFIEIFAAETDLVLSPHPSLLIEVRKRRIPVAVLSLQTSSLDLLLLLLLDFLYSADLSRSQTDHADLQEEKNGSGSVRVSGSDNWIHLGPSS